MTQTVCVIGAGPSGIAVTRALRDAGFEVVGFERHHDVGGIWDIDNPGTPMYRSAHLISSRTHSPLCDVAMPEDYPDYPSHRQLLAYLRALADQLGVREHFSFSTTVAAVQPTETGWDVTTVPTAGGDETTTHVDAVVMCSGNQWVPNVPEYPGTFDGEVRHSNTHRDLTDFTDRRVLIVGAGNSGCDIACDAAQTAESAWISMRRGYRFVPKHIFGMPSDVFAHRGPSLPGKLEQKALTKLLDVLNGDLTRLGLQKPDHDVLASHPILNTRILDHLAHGDLTAKPDVERLDGDGVVFVDGTRVEVDLIIWATGYRVSFPYLADGVVTPRRNDPDLFLNVSHRGRDDIFALGILEVDASAWPIITQQAELVARSLTVRRDAPEVHAQLRALVQTHPDVSGGVDHVDSPRHDYYTQDAAYRAYMARLLDALQRRDLGLLAAPSMLRRLRDLVPFV